MCAKGIFITFEGPEGGGKSTQIKLLAERLESLGRTVVSTREPGGTKLGECIRGILQHDTAGEPPCERAESLLFCASRAQLVKNVIEPALANGSCVLSDRFTDSTVAYQGFGRGLPIDTLKTLNDFATGGRHPDLTLVLDVPTSVGMQRLVARSAANAEGPDRFEREAIEFHTRMREGYLSLAAEEPARCVVVDAARSVEEVSDEIWRIVTARLA